MIMLNASDSPTTTLPKCIYYVMYRRLNPLSPDGTLSFIVFIILEYNTTIFQTLSYFHESSLVPPKYSLTLRYVYPCNTCNSFSIYVTY